MYLSELQLPFRCCNIRCTVICVFPIITSVKVRKDDPSLSNRNLYSREEINGSKENPWRRLNLKYRRSTSETENVSRGDGAMNNYPAALSVDLILPLIPMLSSRVNKRLESSTRRVATLTPIIPRDSPRPGVSIRRWSHRPYSLCLAQWINALHYRQ